MTRIDFDRLGREILIVLRGDLSQIQMNRKLGYRSNQIHRWESGVSKISWIEFCDLAASIGAPLEGACFRTLGCGFSPRNVPKLMEHLLGNAKQSELARRAGVSGSTISRWRAAKLTPTLPQMLKLIEGSVWSLTVFLSGFLDPAQLKSLRKELESERKERELHYKYPWIGPLLLVLLSEDYEKLPAHQDGFIAEKIGLSLEDERKALSELRTSGTVVLRGRKYVPRSRRIDVGRDPEGNKRIRAYWLARCQALLASGGPQASMLPGQWPYMVFSMDSSSFEIIRSRILHLFQEIETLSQNSGGVNEIYFFSSQLLDIRQLPFQSPQSKLRRG